MFSLLREGSPSFGEEGKIQRVKGCGGKSREARKRDGYCRTLFRIENRRGYLFNLFISSGVKERSVVFKSSFAFRDETCQDSGTELNVLSTLNCRAEINLQVAATSSQSKHRVSEPCPISIYRELLWIQIMAPWFRTTTLNTSPLVFLEILPSK